MSIIKPITFRISSYADKVLSKITQKMPNITVSSESVNNGIKWVGKHISSPQNRLILGASALMSQPFIDLHNKRVDEETRKVSAARTVAKILAGTTSGYLVRYYSIKIVDKMAKMPAKNLKSWETFLTPSPKFVKLTLEMLGHYKKALGTLLALGVMLCTNFLFDAPVTKFLTNKFVAMNKEQEEKNRKKFSAITIYTPHKSSSNLIDKAVNMSNERRGGV